MTDAGGRLVGSPVPDFPPHVEWVRTPWPLGFDGDLAGRVVFVAFWTRGCAHSWQLLRTLASLQERFVGRPFAVVTVYAGRDPDDAHSWRARDAAARWRVPFPVAVDTEGLIAQAFGAKAWPTLAVIDGAGIVQFVGAGEAEEERLADAAHALCESIDGGGGGPWDPLELCEDEEEGGVLSFPTGLAHDPARGLVWIADTGHDRLVAIADSGTEETARIVHGGVHAGCLDGSFEEALFDAPTGLAYDAARDRVYVADSGNHAVRVVDLDHEHVWTLEDRHGAGVGARDYALPAGVAVLPDDRLLVALAGSHVLRALDPDDMLAETFAGIGASGSVDGTRLGAALTQPAGLAQGDGVVWVGDRSGLRSIESGHSGRLWTRLERAGPFPALAWDGDRGQLYAAAPFEDAVLRFDVASGRVDVLREFGAAREIVRRPEGVAVGGGALWIADTDQHRVLRFDLESEAVTAVPLRRVPARGSEPAQGSEPERGGERSVDGEHP